MVNKEFNKKNTDLNKKINFLRKSAEKLLKEVKAKRRKNIKSFLEVRKMRRY